MTFSYAHNVHVAVVMIGRDAIFPASICWQVFIIFQAATRNSYLQSVGMLLILIFTWIFWTVFRILNLQLSQTVLNILKIQNNKPHYNKIQRLTKPQKAILSPSSVEELDKNIIQRSL